MKISIDQQRCEGHGRCWETAPELVADDEDGRGVVRDPAAAIAAEHLDQARRAAAVCPERAVVLSD